MNGCDTTTSSSVIVTLVALGIHYFLREKWFPVECADCGSLFQTTVREVCEEFRANRLIGDFCDDVCDPRTLQSFADWKTEVPDPEAGGPGQTVRLIHCPDQCVHSGKELVATLMWRERKLVLKSGVASLRSLEEMRGQGVIHGQDDYATIINDALAAVAHVDQKISQNIHHLSPWQEKDFALMNVSSRRTLSLLIQDREFLTTQVMQALPRYSLHPDKLFPQIVSSCGHLYLSEFGDHVLDMSLILPSCLPFYGRRPEEKVEMGVKLLQFLIRFTSRAPELELCDVKLHQFALFLPSDSILQIDSDMIYSKSSVRQWLEGVQACDSNRDCDFFDCRGICLSSSSSSSLGVEEKSPSICRRDDGDNNLKRFCRNVIFPLPLHLLGFRVQAFGLLSDLESAFADDVSRIRRLCDSSTDATVLPNAQQILQIMEGVKMKIKNGL